MSSPQVRHLSRFAAEWIAAALTCGIGVAVVVGAREYGTGWTDAGPEPGAFPFYVGIIVIAASLGNALAALRARNPAMMFIDATQLGRIARFAIPMTVFVAACVVAGFYVATLLYLALAMRFQGGYRWPASLAVAIGTAAFFYVVLELWFKVALLKGPLEAALGIH
jgi:hypothetical protein